MEDAADNLKWLFRDFDPITIKHDGFKHEKEWRLVLGISLQNKGNIQPFFVEGRYPIPRIRVPLRGNEGGINSDIITGVVFGPGSDQRLATTSINALNGVLNTKYKVAFSKIPYRP